MTLHPANPELFAIAIAVVVAQLVAIFVVIPLVHKWIERTKK